ncbi:MAG: aminodeoxychorismate/anthranilate synthase component II [Endomicrobiales bacterium]|nr:aminodeoxychorismate/anthranilate synthase component II [Endomicrobiales bacterium]
MILVIDNYDSFVYNIVQYLGEWEKNVRVFRNDCVTLDAIGDLDPDAIIVSPGPGVPSDAGISNDCIRRFAGKVPIFGVCLGHQSIGEVFGGKIVRAKNLMHGKTSMIMHDGKTVFTGIRNPVEATRYHSLIVEKESLPAVLEISAHTRDGEVMGLRHREYMVEGVQFHPESILTLEGKRLLKNFVDMARQFKSNRRKKEK